MSEYRPVHRLTPLLRLWSVLVAMVAITILNLNASALAAIDAFLRGGHAWVPILLGIGGFVVVCGVVWVGSYAWWKATGYRLTDEEVALKKGVLSKQERTARYDRIQAVDVVEPLVARLFRVAAVRIETAGGTRSVIEIAFLTKPEASALRAEVLAHTSAEPPADSATADVVVEEIPIQRTLAAAALNFGTLFTVAFVVLVAVSPLGLVTAVPVVVGAVPSIWRLVDRSWRFRAQLVDAGDALDINFGLASRRRQTIPLDRIHGVQIARPLLWRLPGWWLVKVSVAGYGNERDKTTGTTTLLPVGSREQALKVAALVGPLDRTALEESAAPEGATRASFSSPARARWVSPIDVNKQSVTLIGPVVVCHHGRFRQVVSLIDSAHIQELTLVRGPLQNLFNLASVRFDLVPGPVRMVGRDLSVDDGYALLDSLRRRRLPAYHGPHDYLDERSVPATGSGRGSAADGDR